MNDSIKLRVLLVDDSEDDALLITRTLQHGGYDPEYIRVDTNEQMQKALEQSTWDLVTADYAMPQFNGLEAVRTIRALGYDMPIIIVSGTIGEEIAVAAVKAGVNDYVMKHNLGHLVPTVERELQEVAMRRSRLDTEEQLRKISRAVEQSPIAVMITRKDGTIEYINPRFTQMTGYSDEEAIGNTPSIIKSGITPPEEYDELWETISQGNEWNSLLQNRRKDGSLFWVSASMSPVFNAEGEITHYIAIEEDITERKNSEEARISLVERMQRQHATLVELMTQPSINEGPLSSAFRNITKAARETLQVDRVIINAFYKQDRIVYPLWNLDQAGETALRMDIDTFPHYMAALDAGQVIAAANVYIDARTEELADTYWRDQKTAAVIDAAVRVHGQIIGVVSHQFCASMRAWHPDEITFATQVADLVSQAILNTNLLRRAEELATITRISSEVTSVHDLQRVLDTIARNAAKLAGTDASGIFEFQEDGQLIISASYDISEEFLLGLNQYGLLASKTSIDRAAGEKQTVQVDGIQIYVEKQLAAIYEKENIQAEFAVPMLLDGNMIGGIVLWQHRKHHFPEQTIAVIEALAQQCANAVENARLFEEQQRRRREAETLRAVTQALSSTLDLPQVFELILSELQKVVPYDSASVQQLKGDELVIIGGHGFANLDELLGIHFDLKRDDNPNRQVIASREPMVISEASENYGGFQTEPHVAANINSWMGVPLIVGDRAIGMISLDKQEPAYYTNEHARLAQAFATQAAIALENAQIYAEEEQRASELTKALEKQKELDELKDQFIQNVSHELRTPMAIARGYAELLEMGELGELKPEQQQPISIVARRLRMLSRLVDNINAILEAQTKEPEYAPVDIKHLVETAVADFHVTLGPKNIALESNISGNIPSMMGDNVQLRRVLDNLLTNAMKFTPEDGTITVNLRREEKNAIIDVADNGIGIPEDQLGRIFERFYQVDGGMSRRYGGTGLGLALVKEIVTRHNGTVAVRSTVDKGSIFTVCLPV